MYKHDKFIDWYHKQFEGTSPTLTMDPSTHTRTFKYKGFSWSYNYIDMQDTPLKDIVLLFKKKYEESRVRKNVL